MKRTIEVGDDDRLNFFRLYDSCLMDVAALSWCKCFGSTNENLHWKKLFPDSAERSRTRLEDELRAAVDDLDSLSKALRNYRDTYVAHHDLNQNKRAQQHPDLSPLRQTGWLYYRAVFDALQRTGQAHGLPHPDQIDGSKLKEIERHWKTISKAARDATKSFEDCPRN